MEKGRRLASGRLSELFGKKALGMDKFARTVGHRKIAQETWDDTESDHALSQEGRELLQAYADGVNDYLEGVGYFHEEITGFFLPPEFYALKHQHAVEPWTPVDSLALMRIMNFHLSMNWSQDLLREIYADLEGGELAEMAAELAPYTAEHMFTPDRSTLDDEDMKSAGLWSAETLLARHKQKKPFDWRSDEEIAAEEAAEKAKLQTEADRVKAAQLAKQKQEEEERKQQEQER